MKYDNLSFISMTANFNDLGLKMDIQMKFGSMEQS